MDLELDVNSSEAAGLHCHRAAASTSGSGAQAEGSSAVGGTAEGEKAPAEQNDERDVGCEIEDPETPVPVAALSLWSTPLSAEVDPLNDGLPRIPTVASHPPERRTVIHVPPKETSASNEPPRPENPPAPTAPTQEGGGPDIAIDIGYTGKNKAANLADEEVKVFRGWINSIPSDRRPKVTEVKIAILIRKSLLDSGSFALSTRVGSHDFEQDAAGTFYSDFANEEMNRVSLEIAKDICERHTGAVDSDIDDYLTKVKWIDAQGAVFASAAAGAAGFPAVPMLLNSVAAFLAASATTAYAIASAAIPPVGGVLLAGEQAQHISAATKSVRDFRIANAPRTHVATVAPDAPRLGGRGEELFAKARDLAADRDKTLNNRLFSGAFGLLCGGAASGVLAAAGLGPPTSSQMLGGWWSQAAKQAIPPYASGPATWVMQRCKENVQPRLPLSALGLKTESTQDGRIRLVFDGAAMEEAARAVALSSTASQTTADNLGCAKAIVKNHFRNSLSSTNKAADTELIREDAKGLRAAQGWQTVVSIGVAVIARSQGLPSEQTANVAIASGQFTSYVATGPGGAELGLGRPIPQPLDVPPLAQAGESRYTAERTRHSFSFPRYEPGGKAATARDYASAVLGTVAATVVLPLPCAGFGYLASGANFAVSVGSGVKSVFDRVRPGAPAPNFLDIEAPRHVFHAPQA